MAVMAATPEPTTPNPDPWFSNYSVPLGPHARTITEVNAVSKSAKAHKEAEHALGYAKYLDAKMQKALREQARAIKPFTDPPPVSFPEWWPHARPFDGRWVAPPMASDITRMMRTELHFAAVNVSREVPAVVHKSIIDATWNMIWKLRNQTLPPTTLMTTTTTTTTEPPPPPPPEPPAAAPAPAAPAPGPAGPAAPAPPEAVEEECTMYVMGVDNNYYALPCTTGAPTPMFTTTPNYMKAADGSLFLPPVTGGPFR